MKNRRGIQLVLILAAVFLGVWLALRYLMPVALPFLVGAGVAALAEPGVSRLTEKAKLPRALGAGLCVTGVYLLLCGILYFLGVVAYRELGSLARSLPQTAATLAAPMGRLRDWVYGLTDKAPKDLRPMLESGVSSLFEGASSLAAKGAGLLLNLVTNVVGSLPGSFLFLGTAVISSFMISAQFPKIKLLLVPRLPEAWRERVLPVMHRVRQAVGGWFRAQAKLMGLTFLILTAGFLILRVRYAILFGALVALVDALPMLGTGTVLIPWSLLRFLDGDPAMGIGLLALYAVALTTRSTLEPRLVGKHMGLPPLLTLCAMYAGFRLWGILGMLLAPVLTICATEIYNLCRVSAKKELHSSSEADMISKKGE